jgi:hypothetical protein
MTPFLDRPCGGEVDMARKKHRTRRHDPRVSEHGWYVALIVNRYDYYWQDITNPNRRCKVYENTCLIRARNPGEAYKKALALGQVGDGAECVDQDQRGRKGVWRFVGLANLLPVYERIEDGCEILWTTYYCTAKTAQRMVRKKNELGVFRRSQELGSRKHARVTGGT